MQNQVLSAVSKQGFFIARTINFHTVIDQGLGTSPVVWLDHMVEAKNTSSSPDNGNGEVRLRLMLGGLIIA